MDRNEFLNHNIYVPDVWDESIIAYLNLGFKCLFKIGYTLCLVQLWTENIIPGHELTQLYKLRLCNDVDLNQIYIFNKVVIRDATVRLECITIVYISDANIFLKRINHNMYE